MVINLDILIIENSIINYFLLYITSQTLRIGVKLKSLVLSSVIGGIYVITMISPKLYLFTRFPFKVAVAEIMIFLIFKNKKIGFNIKALSIYLIYSMMLAGICFFLELHQNSSSDFTSIIINYSYKKLLLAIIFIYLSISRIVIVVRDRKEILDFIFKVDIVDKNNLKTVTAFLDTGNELREPATNLPVIIIEKSCFGNLNLRDNEKLLVPYKVLNGTGGNLIGFKPDYIVVYKGNYKVKREVVIAFCEDKLNKHNEYNALLSRGII